MAQHNLILRNLTSDLSVGGQSFGFQLLTATAGAATQVLSPGANVTLNGYGWTQPNTQVNVDQPGNWTVKLDIPSGASQIEIAARLARVNSSGTVQAESDFTDEQTGNAGPLEYTFTNLDLGTFAATDRLRVQYRFRNTDTMMARDITVGFNTAASGVDVPEPPPTPVEVVAGEVLLATPDDPGRDDFHTLRLRARQSAGSGGTLFFGLYEGATEIAASSGTLTGSFQNFTLNLSSGQAGGITDRSDLRVRWWAEGEDPMTVEVADAWLDLPEGEPSDVPQGSASFTADDALDATGRAEARGSADVAVTDRLDAHGGTLTGGSANVHTIDSFDATGEAPTVSTAQGSADFHADDFLGAEGDNLIPFYGPLYRDSYGAGEPVIVPSEGSAEFTASDSVNAAGARPSRGSGDFNASDDVDTVGRAPTRGSAEFNVEDTLAPFGSTVTGAVADVHAEDTVEAHGVAVAKGSAEFTADDLLDATGLVEARGSADVHTTDAVEAVGQAGVGGFANIRATDHIEAHGQAVPKGWATLNVTDALEATGQATPQGSAEFHTTDQVDADGFAATPMAHGTATINLTDLLDAVGVLHAHGVAPVTVEDLVDAGGRLEARGSAGFTAQDRIDGQAGRVGTILALFTHFERPLRWDDAQARPPRWLEGDGRPTHWDDADSRPARWFDTTRPQQWRDTTRPQHLYDTQRPARHFVAVVNREEATMALVPVSFGPYTVLERPESLFVRVFETLRDGTTTQPLELHGQSPAWTASVSIMKPNAGSAVTRAAVIVDPASLPVDDPDNFDAPEEGWIRIDWQDNDFADAGEYALQITLDNTGDGGSLRLKSQNTWNPTVVTGPAAEVGAS